MNHQHRKCPCGAIYRRTHVMASRREVDSFECSVCGETLESWNSAWVPSSSIALRRSTRLRVTAETDRQSSADDRPHGAVCKMVPLENAGECPFCAAQGSWILTTSYCENHPERQKVSEN